MIKHTLAHAHTHTRTHTHIHTHTPEQQGQLSFLKMKLIEHAHTSILESKQVHSGNGFSHRVTSNETTLCVYHGTVHKNQNILYVFKKSM